MKILGLVTEYNPFHNGHLYHLSQSKAACGATHSVAVMSGHFLQRGEPALFDKWTRAEMAVRSGVDLIIELPLVYSSQTAEIFAHGAVSILDSMSCVDFICFGSESGNTDNLKTISSILAAEPNDFRLSLKAYLDKGVSFPTARENALLDHVKNSSPDGPPSHLTYDIKSPNNILGIEYMKSLIRIKSKISPYTIKRISADYNSKEISGSICSATAIREHMRSGASPLQLEGVLTAESFKILKSKISCGFSPVFDSSFFDMLAYSIISKSPEELSSISEVKEGIFSSVSKYARTCKSYEELVESLKSKRYTLTGIKRMLSNILLGIKKHDIAQFKEMCPAPYARVLAFNEKGSQILRSIKTNSNMQIITKTANARFSNPFHKLMFEYDIKATDIYNIVYYSNRHAHLSGSADYLTSPYFIK